MPYPYKNGFPDHPPGTWHGGILILRSQDYQSIWNKLDDLGVDVQLLNFHERSGLPEGEQPYIRMWVYSHLPEKDLMLPGVLRIDHVSPSPFTPKPNSNVAIQQ